MANQQVNRVIIVLSPGRSGTSLLMQALGAVGMSLSENMVLGNFSNPDGHFEDKDIMDLHVRLFSEIGGHPYMPLPDGWLQSSSVHPIKRQLAELVKNHISNSSSLWGFKDPRTNAFLPLWFRIINPEKIVPVFIFAARRPESTIASYIKQYNDSPSLAELAWLTRTTDALQHTAADCFIVHYEDWFTRPSEVAQGLLSYTGLDTYFTGNAGEALKSVIKPNLNRAVYEDYEVKNEYVLKLYEVLKDCRGADFDRKRLMGVVKECRKAMDGFKGWYLEAQKFLGQANTFRQNMQECREQLKQKQERIDSLRKARAALEKELEKQSSASQVSIPAPSPLSMPIDIEAVPDLERLVNLAMETVRELANYRACTADLFEQNPQEPDDRAGRVQAGGLGDAEAPHTPRASRLLLILGAPRSGVGVVGQCLEAVGMRGLAWPNDYDEKAGSGSSKGLMDLMHGLALPECSQFDPLPRDWWASPAVNQARDVISRALERSAEMPYLADVCVGRVFPIWEQAAIASGREIRVVHVFRHPWETVASIARHCGLDSHRAGYVWLRCIRDIVDICRGRGHVFVSLDQLLADPLSTLGIMAHALALPITVTDHAERLFSLIQPERKQFQASSADLPDRAVFTLHRQVYHELCSVLSLFHPSQGVLPRVIASGR